MSCAVGSKSAAEMWVNLKLKFAAPNRQNILQLKSNLQGLKKGDALETVGVFLDDEDIVVVVLRGLPSEYVAIKTVIRAQFVTCTMGELKTLLKAVEVDIENEMQSSSPLNLTALLAKNQASPPSSSASSTTSLQAASSSGSPTITLQSPNANVPPGFSPLPQTAQVQQPVVTSQPPYIPIHALPYGFSPYTPFAMRDTSFPMTGFYVGRGRNNNFTGGRGNGVGRGVFFSNRNNNATGGNGFNRNNGNFNSGNFYRNNNNNNAGGTSITCQLCGKVGHGAKTCRSLNNFNPGGA
ncbi:uncharacterized protein LOC133744184 [Rosa rugosa]|uniref:uncharacterized protein LOC133744184 n=1 Tax=Rosa rugosa TaxID=74645 RepID=UPI002B40DD24|nr:uncharacterized protein LOC133744184 [Rosa rugosa]